MYVKKKIKKTTKLYLSLSETRLHKFYVPSDLFFFLSYIIITYSFSHLENTICSVRHRRMMKNFMLNPVNYKENREFYESSV